MWGTNLGQKLKTPKLTGFPPHTAPCEKHIVFPLFKSGPTGDWGIARQPGWVQGVWALVGNKSGVFLPIPRLAKNTLFFLFLKLGLQMTLGSPGNRGRFRGCGHLRGTNLGQKLKKPKLNGLPPHSAPCETHLVFPLPTGDWGIARQQGWVQGVRALVGNKSRAKTQNTQIDWFSSPYSASRQTPCFSSF